MSTRVRVALLIAAAALSLSACATTPTTGQAPTINPMTTNQPAEPAEPAVDVPELSERGLIRAHIGEEVRLHVGSGVGSGGGLGSGPPAAEPTPALRFTITNAEFTDTCGKSSKYMPATRPENGHFLRLQVEVHTGPDYSHAINPFVFPQWVDDQGITHAQAQSSAVMMCAGGTDMLPSNMGPGQNYRGAVLLDVPTTSGIALIQTMGYQMGTGEGGGWEFPIGETA